MKRLLSLLVLGFFALASAQAQFFTPPINVIGGTIGCSGGTVTTDGSDTIHTFLSSGSLTCSTSVTAELLIVAGGASGGGGSGLHGTAGGGGAGEYISEIGHSLSPGIYPVVVGLGGTGVAGSGAGNAPKGNNGQDSSFDGLTAKGGGAGGGASSDATGRAGNGGGSGGGGGSTSGGGGRCWWYCITQHGRWQQRICWLISTWRRWRWVQRCGDLYSGGALVLLIQSQEARLPMRLAAIVLLIQVHQSMAPMPLPIQVTEAEVVVTTERVAHRVMEVQE